MKKPVPNKFAPAFEDQPLAPTKARRSLMGSSASRPDRLKDTASKLPKVAYKRCKQAIVESMADTLADDDADGSVAAIKLSEAGASLRDPQRLQDQPQQQQQAEDRAALSEALREQAASLLTLRWAGLRHKKTLDS